MSQQASKKTILGFDSWTQGSHHYARLVQAFDAIGYRLILIHIGSWGHDRTRPSEELINGLLVRDVSYYPDRSFEAILRTENPAAVIFLSTRAFAHQAFNRYAAQLGIPTFHLYHGLVNVQAVNADNHQVPYKTNWLKQFSILRKRIFKNLCVLWPVYLKSLVDTKATMSDWGWFIREIYFKVSKPLAGFAPPDTTTLGGFVYTAADLNNIIQSYGIDPRNAHAVGNPDLMHFGLEQADLGCALSITSSTDTDVMYIDTGLIEAGIVFDGEKDFTDHLLKTRQAMSEQGLNLIVKLHPSHFRSGLAQKLAESNIEIIANQDFVKRLRTCLATLVEPSSAAMLPALLGKPVFLVQYGKLQSQAYGLVLTSYPRARFLKNPRQVLTLVQQEQTTLDLRAVEHWIAENSGPMPAHDMPKRIARLVEAMIAPTYSADKTRSVAELTA